jgi:hypothetical protein
MIVGLLFQPGALWIGAHYSSNERRVCINIVPFLTIWIVRIGGAVPKKKSLLQFNC